MLNVEVGKALGVSIATFYFNVLMKNVPHFSL